MQASYFTASEDRRSWRATTLFSRFEPAEPQALLDQVCGVLRLMTRHDHVMVSGETSETLPFLLHCDRPQVIALASALGRFLVADTGATRLHIRMEDGRNGYVTLVFEHDGSLWNTEIRTAFEEMRVAISRQGACLKHDSTQHDSQINEVSQHLDIPLNPSSLTN